MRTFLQLQEDLITQLKESSTDPNYWSRQEIKDALNLADARERVLQSFYKKYVTEKEENQDSEE